MGEEALQNQYVNMSRRLVCQYIFLNEGVSVPVYLVSWKS